EVDLPAVVGARRGPSAYRPVSRYPSSDVDLSFALDEAVPAAALTSALLGTAAPEVVDVRLVDTYRGAGLAEGQRSLTYRVRLQAGDRTLTDAELADLRSRLIEAGSSTGATLRA